MATRWLSFPSDIVPLGGWRRQPLVAADVTEDLGGINRARVYWTQQKQTYEGTFFIDQAEALRSRQLEDLVDRVNGGALPVWFLEPTARWHNVLRVGEGDGSRVSWAVPMYNSTSYQVRAAGVNVAGTAHAQANELTDNQADVETDTTGLVLHGTATIAQSDDYQHHGRYSCAVTPTGSQSNYGVALTANATYMVPCSPGDVLNGMAWFLAGAAFDAEVRLQWYDSTPSLLSGNTGTPVTLTAGQWAAATASATAPASTAYCQLVARRSGGPGTDLLYVDCMGLGYLVDVDEWWLPSAGPGVFVASSAPANGAAITAAGQGQAILPMRLDAAPGIAHTARGHREVNRVRMTEWWGPTS